MKDLPEVTASADDAELIPPVLGMPVPQAADLKKATNHPHSEWVPWADLPARLPRLNLKEQSLNWAMRQRHRNGLSGHTRKFGKHLYAHVQGFEAWWEEGRGD